jgi:hypothetical protein
VEVVVEIGMLEFISVISSFVGAISLLLMVLFVWRHGPAIGSGFRRAVDAALLIGLSRDRATRRLARRLLEATFGNEAEFDLPLLLGGPSGDGMRRPSTGDQGYGVAYFARKHGISRDEADRIIKRVGNDREKLNRAAERAKEGKWAQTDNLVKRCHHWPCRGGG